ncbi:hypothetical protein MASR1M32_35550 [Rhodobacter sp.]
MAIITRVYATYEEARRAAEAVEALHLSGAEASVLGNESLREHYTNPDAASGAATGAGVGAAVGGGAGLLAGLGMLAIPGIGPLVAAGWLAATAVGAAGGALAGGAVGAIADLGLSAEEAPVFSEAVRRGNVAVSVRFRDEDRAAVEGALSAHRNHEYDRLRDTYEAEGWRYDETPEEREARIARAQSTRPML